MSYKWIRLDLRGIWKPPQKMWPNPTCIFFEMYFRWQVETWTTEKMRLERGKPFRVFQKPRRDDKHLKEDYQAMAMGTMRRKLIRDV